MRIPAAALGAALLLSGCPLPQPLPEYSKGTVTPPRIVMDGIALQDTVVEVPAGCTGAKPSSTLAAQLIDNNTTEAVTARWFVDYDPQNTSRCLPVLQSVITAPATGDLTLRQVPEFLFVPYDHATMFGNPDPTAPGVLHVVELVVSNNFDPAADDPGLCMQGSAVARPYRTPASQAGGVQFETQTYRWVFFSVAPTPTVACP